VTAGVPGVLTLQVRAPGGTRVSIVESGSEAATAPPAQVVEAGRTFRRRIGDWSCDARARRFRVTATFPDGEQRVVERGTTTPSCSARLEVTTPKVTAGQLVRVSLRDRFNLGGFATRVCLDGPVGATRCEDVTIASGKRTGSVSLGRIRAGRSVVTAKAPFAPKRSLTLTARKAGQPFRLLATGDSMIQIIDGYLAQRLSGRGGRVTSDAHISTGISKPAMLNWPNHAKASAGSVKPSVTVVILGANDGFNFGSIGCCGDAWSAAYAKRAEGMMRSYLRGGKGRVIWMLLPAPRGSNFANVFRGVNQALVSAASKFSDDQVILLDLRKTFTPGGTYRGSIRWNGQTKQVRQPDGVHFNTAGASIVADLIIRQLRRDGFVG
jgi:lysophospholipase L1-like esterase